MMKLEQEIKLMLQPAARLKTPTLTLDAQV